MHKTARGPSHTALSCGLAALVLLAAPGRTLHAAPCLEPVEKTAFEIRALQSHLMVMALTCGQHESYNAFSRHRQQAARLL